MNRDVALAFDRAAVMRCIRREPSLMAPLLPLWWNW